MASENSGDVGPQRITPSSAGRVEAQARDASKMMADMDKDSEFLLMCDRDTLRSLATRIARQPFTLQSDFARREMLAVNRELDKALDRLELLASECNKRAIEAAKRDGQV